MMQLLHGFAALSLVSGALMALLPDRPIRRTATMVVGLMMLMWWAEGLSTLWSNFPSASATAVSSALTATGLQLKEAEASTQETSP